MSVFSLAKILSLIEKANDHGVNISFSDGELSVHVEKGKQIDRLLLEELRDNKPSLVHYFTNFASTTKQIDSSPQIERFDRRQLTKIPLSFAQERMWFIDQLEGSVQYHLPTVLTLKGKLNRDALSHALQVIINRHEILRTTIREEDGQGFQQVNEENQSRLNIIDGTRFRKDKASLENFIKQLIRAPFDLSKDQMLRADLIAIEDDRHVLVVTMHHIASDAWSTSVLVKEVAELYRSYVEGGKANLLPLEMQYSDYAVWQRNYLQGEVLDKKIEYWRKKLDGLGTLQLPTDYVRPVVQNTTGANAEFSIDKSLAEQLQKLSKQQGATLYMVLLSAFKIMLHRYSGQKDICVGTSIASREHAEFEELIGFFVNTLALRTEVNTEESFTELLQKVRSTTLQAYENVDVPFERVVEAVVKERDASRNPLFQIMLVLANTPEVSQLRLGELELVKEDYEPKISKFDITFFVTETPAGLHGLVQYRTDLFTEGTVTKMIGHFKELLSSIVKAPEQQVGSFQMLTRIEEQQIAEFNQATVAYRKDKTIVDLFEEVVAKTPGDIALVFDDHQMTYGELNECANQLAHYLRNRGVKEDTLVPLCVERSHEMMVGMLGILKAGAAYVPMEPDFPEDRKIFMLEDTGAIVVVCSQQTSFQLPTLEDLDIIEVDGEWSAVKAQPKTNPVTVLAPHHLAYVIYTSGSTGRPKGVMIEHHNLVDYVFGLKQHTKIDQCRSYALVSSIATDLGNTVIYSALAFGGALHVFSKESVSNIEYLHDYFSRHSIDCLKIVPSHWKALSSQNNLLLPARLLVFGGEALQSELIEQIRQSGSACTIVNHYGPTETTIGKLLHVVETGRRYNKTIPIGRPFSNTKVYVLSKTLQLCPIGVGGELLIGGDGIARGYLNNHELTKEKFIQIPSTVDRRPSTDLLYRTGDLVRWLSDGNIEFIGRVDDQVKIRGYRVELGEIESMLLQYSGIQHAAVLAREDSSGNKRLVGYLVATEGYDKESMIAFMEERLPDYMVPGQWVELEEFPMLPNGKVDRKALPDPEVSEQLSGQYVAPRNPVESKLADLWKDVLEVDQVGVYDDFFELGGHSLLAVRLISAIRKEFVVEMPIGDIFDHPTVAKLAEKIGRADSTLLPPITVNTSRPEKLPLSFSQERLWFIDRLEGSIQYHVTTVLRLKGKLNLEALEFSLQTIVNRHEVLRTVIIEQDGDPYQAIKNENQWKLTLIDGAGLQNEDVALHHEVRRYIRKPFDLASDDMMRAALFTMSADEYILVVTIHHIASDGWSKSVLVKEVVSLYSSFVENRPANLPALPVQYADYALWQRQYLEGEILDKKIAYWKEKLHNTTPLQLPTDYPRPAVQTVKGARMGFEVDVELSKALQQLSHQQGCTMFMTLLASLNVLLHRYSGQKDICIGSPIANRMQQELEELIGFFVNTLALRSDIDPDASFRELLQQVKQTTMEAYQHQEAPFEKVVEAVVKGRDMSRNPLFQVMFVLRNTPEVPELRFKEMSLAGVGFEHSTALFDMTFFITETDNGLDCSVEYSTDLFSPDTISRMIIHFRELLRSIVTNPQHAVGKLPFLTKQEEYQLLVGFNDTAVTYPDKSIVDLLEEQALKTPDAKAIVFEDQVFSYHSLYEEVNRFANYLLDSYKLKADETVAVLLERSALSAIAMLAIFKTGACYVPVDVKLPENRLKYILDDAAPKVIITSELLATKHASLLAGDHIIAESLDLQHMSSQNPGVKIQPDDLSYIIYTSGSTGMPKGVMQTHRMLYNLVQWDNDLSGLPWNMKITQYASFAFDSSLHDICFSLTNGGSSYVLAEGIRLDFPALAKYIVDHQIEIVSLPFSALSNFFNIIDSSLLDGHNIKAIISTGEQLVIGSKLEQFLEANPHIPIHNLYGPSETHVVTASSFTADKKLPKHIPIGKPIANSTIYILDRYNNPVPINVTGEVYIGGHNLARGYLKNAQLTNQKFVQSFFNPAEILYKTGDMGRWLADGTIEYLGRFDDQVKIRGYRIELGEIETLLHQCEWVKQAVVLAKDDKEGNKRLVAYIVPQNQFDRKAIVSHLKALLPEYMIPALWVELERLPLTPNGKVDKRALPDPDAGELLKNEYVAPRNNTETILVEMWQDLLGVKQVGVYDNFFELGGHSLMVIKMVANIKKRFSLSIPISALFQFTCIDDLSKYLEWEIHSMNQNNIDPETPKTTEEDKSSFEVLNL